MDYSAQQILAFRIYQDLFSAQPALAQKERQRLLKKWHPDLNSDPKAEQVFIHINQIFNQASVRQKYQTLRINHTDYDYFFSHENNIYTVYYLDQAQIILHFKHKATSLKNNIIQNLNSIKTMLTHHPLKARYQDILDIRVLATDNDDYLKIAFHPRYLPLILVKNYIYETQDWKMSAWIISRLFDTALLLQNNDLNFTGCDVNLIFVDTVSHYIIDLSALFFSTSGQMIALSPTQVKAIFPDAIAHKICDEDSSNNLIKFLALYLSGDEQQLGNLNLFDHTQINTTLIQQILAIDCQQSLYDNYNEWQTHTLKKVFSKRAFHKKELSLNELLHRI